jgi:hypothetical protein
MSHIRHVKELTGKEEREVSLRRLLLGIAKQSLDGNTVSRLLRIRGLGILGVLRVIRVLRVIGVLGILGRGSLCFGGAAVGTGLQGPDEGTNGEQQNNMGIMLHF